MPMMKRALAVISVLVFWAILLSATPATISVAVVRVVDGDTVVVQDAGGTTIKVRIADIDAPELKQPFGQQARTAAINILAGKTVVLRSRGKGYYGRTLGTLVLPSGVTLGELLIASGNAWVYPSAKKVRRDELGKLQTAAKAAKKGLWSHEHPQPPWEYRKERRK